MGKTVQRFYPPSMVLSQSVLITYTIFFLSNTFSFSAIELNSFMFRPTYPNCPFSAKYYIMINTAFMHALVCLAAHLTCLLLRCTVYYGCMTWFLHI